MRRGRVRILPRQPLVKFLPRSSFQGHNSSFGFRIGHPRGGEKVAFVKVIENGPEYKGISPGGWGGGRARRFRKPRGDPIEAVPGRQQRGGVYLRHFTP